jgi:hypothetical protein
LENKNIFIYFVKILQCWVNSEVVGLARAPEALRLERGPLCHAVI